MNMTLNVPPIPLQNGEATHIQLMGYKDLVTRCQRNVLPSEACARDREFDGCTKTAQTQYRYNFDMNAHAEGH